MVIFGADATAQQIERMRAADYSPKPVQAAHLIAVVNGFLDRVSAPG